VLDSQGVNRKRVERIPAQYKDLVTKQLESLSTMVRKRRDGEGLTQEALAEDLDIDPQTIAYIEQRRRYPSLSLLFTICARLKIKVQFK
jgi:DNA-binding XRE family transcriptional regulator